MAHRRQADAYDYLATSKVSELTVAQLEQALENSYLNKSNIEFWKGPITMHRLLEVSRTYPWGIAIPEQSAIFVPTPADPFGTLTIQPPGTEVWNIKAIRGFGQGGSATTTLSYADGTSVLDLRVGDTILPAGSLFDMNNINDGPVVLTNSLYLTIVETGGAVGVAVMVAYNKVSM